MAKWYISVGLCLCCWSNLCAYKVVNGRIILDKEESKEFLKDIFHPDVEALKKGMHSSEILKIGPFNA